MLESAILRKLQLLSRRKKEEGRRKKGEDIHSKLESDPYFTFTFN